LCLHVEYLSEELERGQGSSLHEMAAARPMPLFAAVIRTDLPTSVLMLAGLTAG